MSIYSYEDYREYLQEKIHALKRPGLMSYLAQFAGCNRTYLSQVIAGTSHLTPDHAMGLAEPFGLDEGEADFFLLLLLKERSSHVGVRQKLEQRIAKLRAEKMNFERKFPTGAPLTKLSKSDLLHYYSNWRYAAARMLILVPQTRTLNAIAPCLGLTVTETAELLRRLVDMKLVRLKDDKYSTSELGIGKPSDAILDTLHHMSWRAMAIDQVKKTGGVHVSVPFTLSAKEARDLKRQLLEFLEKQRGMVRISKAGEEVHVFCCDFFRLA